MKKYNCIVVLGPTASGKTRLACHLAYHINGEIISADSRQVYQYLNIGTGKDLDEYTVKDNKINHHLIDVIHPAEQFYLHQFVQESRKAFDEIKGRGKIPLICGGTGLYLDSFRKDFSLTQVPENPTLRATLENLPKEELLARIKKYPLDLVAHIDLDSKKRIVRGIEIAEHLTTRGQIIHKTELPYKPYYIGIKSEIDSRKKLISERLANRLNAGLVDEVSSLLDMGIREERIAFFGLEYKFVLNHLQNKISKEELREQLQTAIFQFAKRQMTWFRKMEKEGVEIHWVDKETDINNLTASLSFAG